MDCIASNLLAIFRQLNSISVKGNIRSGYSVALEQQGEIRCHAVRRLGKLPALPEHEKKEVIQ